MTEQMIIDAYCRIRKIDNTIPDEVLNFMKESALLRLRQKEKEIQTMRLEPEIGSPEWRKLCEVIFGGNPEIKS